MPVAPKRKAGSCGPTAHVKYNDIAHVLGCTVLSPSNILNEVQARMPGDEANLPCLPCLQCRGHNNY